MAPHLLMTELLDFKDNYSTLSGNRSSWVSGCDCTHKHHNIHRNSISWSERMHKFQTMQMKCLTCNLGTSSQNILEWVLIHFYQTVVSENGTKGRSRFSFPFLLYVVLSHVRAARKPRICGRGSCMCVLGESLIRLLSEATMMKNSYIHKPDVALYFHLLCARRAHCLILSLCLSFALKNLIDKGLCVLNGLRAECLLSMMGLNQ